MMDRDTATEGEDINVHVYDDVYNNVCGHGDVNAMVVYRRGEEASDQGA